MYAPAGVKTDHNKLPVPERMRAWVLGDPEQLVFTEKPVPVPGRAEVLVRIDAVAICATDLDNIYHGPPALIQGGLPFNKNWTPGHEYMGTVVALGPAQIPRLAEQALKASSMKSNPIALTFEESMQVARLAL